MWKAFKHKLKHFLNIQTGKVVSIKLNSEQEQYWIGFQCEICGDITSLCEPLGSDWVMSKRNK